MSKEEDTEMNFQEAKEQFGEQARIPKTIEDGFLLSGDGIFQNFQGEGKTIGCPAVFIRLHGCNLSCGWEGDGGQICDAWYTWKTDTKEYWTEHYYMTFKELYDKIRSYNCSRIILTGGEPLMQQTQIGKFIKEYLDDPDGEDICWDVEIETNGTILPTAIASVYNFVDVWYNCSPKLSNAGPQEEKLRIKPDVLDELDKRGASFKFVVTRLEDLEEIEEVRKAAQIKSEHIILMPEGVDAEILSERMRYFAKYAIEKGWRMVPRLQIYLWGNKRGT